jgi:uncharacterized repeat protein (TIGR01451 family)
MCANTGDVTLTNVNVTDQFATPGGPALTVICRASSLAPGEAETCSTAEPYKVSQADADHGGIVNTAVAHGTTPTGDVVDSAPSTATVTIPRITNLLLIKQVKSGTVIEAPGDVIIYEFVVVNGSNVTLRNVALTDTQFPPAGSLTGQPTCPLSSLPGATSMVCTGGTYTVTQADIDNGSVKDQASVTGTPPTGPPLDATSSIVTVPLPTNPSISIQKTALPPVVHNVGDTIDYTFHVTNTGNQTLSNVAVLDSQTNSQDPAVTVSCPGPSLAVGDSMDCTGSYNVTQDDVDHGTVDDTATATGTPGTGTPVSAQSTASVSVPAEPALSVVKAAEPPVAHNAGDAIDYSFAVTNDGNVTLSEVNVSDQFTAADDAAITVDCPESSLAPASSMTCTAGPHIVTEEDAARGGVEDTAVAHGTPPTGQAVDSDSSTASVPVTGDPALTVTNKASVDQVHKAGDPIGYSFVVKNTGNVALSDVSVSDEVVAPVDPALTVSCPGSSLAVGASMTCATAQPYSVTQADVDHGSVANTAVAQGISPSGAAVESTASSIETPVVVEQQNPPAPTQSESQSGASSSPQNNAGSGAAINTGLGANAAVHAPTRIATEVAGLGLIATGVGLLLLLARRRRAG